MKLSLLLDSSDQNLTIGFAEGKKVLCGVSFPAWQRQSELMVAEIDRLMKDNNITRDQIGAVVVGKGPGSYTGVRIALSVAKVTSLALSIPLYLASSLEILKNPGKTSLCVINARSKRSYVGLYSESGPLMEDAIWTNAEVLDYLQAHSEVVLCGDCIYLGQEGELNDLLANLAACADEAHRVEEPLGAKPVYLKDNYDKGPFKTVVRKMMPSDMEDVLALEKECFIAPYNRQQLLYELNENPVASVYVAIVDHEIVGFLDFDITFTSAYINQICVKPSYRRKGIAQLLYAQMEKDLNTQEEFVEYVSLEVRVHNEAAHSLYLKLGFEDITINKQYYENGDDGIYMVRSRVNG